MDRALYCTVDNPDAHIKDLIRRGFKKVLPDRDGNVAFKGLSRRFPFFSAVEISEAKKLRGLDCLVWDCYAKDHGLFIEMHSVGAGGRDRIRKDYKACPKALKLLTRYLVNEKKDYLSSKKKSDKLRNQGIAASLDLNTRIRIINEAPEALRLNRAKLNKVISRQCADLIQIVRIEQAGRWYYAFDIANNKSELQALANFYVAYEDARSLISMNDSGLSSKGKSGPSRKQENKMLARAKALQKAAKESMLHIGQDLELSNIEQRNNMPAGNLSEYQSSGLTPLDWANKVAYSEVMNRPGTGAIVKKIKAKHRRER